MGGCPYCSLKRTIVLCRSSKEVKENTKMGGPKNQPRKEVSKKHWMCPMFLKMRLLTLLDVSNSKSGSQKRKAGVYWPVRPYPQHHQHELSTALAKRRCCFVTDESQIGGGSRFKSQGTAGSIRVHLPGVHCGPPFLSHTQMMPRSQPERQSTL